MQNDHNKSENIFIDVSPQTGISMKNSISRYFDEIAENIDNINKAVSELDSVWKSRSSSFLVELFFEETDGISDKCSHIKEHFAKLDIIMDNYTSAEGMNMRDAHTLPSNLIE